MQDSQKQQAFVKKWFQFSIWTLIPIMLFDWLGKPLFVLVNGNIYEKSFPVFVVFSFGIWLSLLLSPLVNILLARNQFQFLFFLGIAALCANILLNLLLVPLLGGIGAAIVVIITNGSINLTAFLRVVLFDSWHSHTRAI